jgi:hypothetical protein
LVGCLVVLTGCATLFIGFGTFQSGLNSPGKQAHISLVFRCTPTSPTACNTGIASGGLSDEGSNATFPNGVRLTFNGVMRANNNPGDLDNCMSARLSYMVTSGNTSPPLASGGGLTPDQLLGTFQRTDGIVAVTACARGGGADSANTVSISVLSGPYMGYAVSAPVQGNFIAGRG